MASTTLAALEDQLRRLAPEQLALVARFVATLTRRQDDAERAHLLLAAESALRKDWDRPGEDEAWANL